MKTAPSVSIMVIASVGAIGSAPRGDAARERSRSGFGVNVEAMATPASARKARRRMAPSSSRFRFSSFGEKWASMASFPTGAPAGAMRYVTPGPAERNAALIVRSAVTVPPGARRRLCFVWGYVRNGTAPGEAGAETLVYGYHDPFITPSFLRRNEVAVRVDPGSVASSAAVAAA